MMRFTKTVLAVMMLMLLGGLPVFAQDGGGGSPPDSGGASEPGSPGSGEIVPLPAESVPGGAPISGGEIGMPTQLLQCEWGDLIIQPPPTIPPMGSPDGTVSSGVIEPEVGIGEAEVAIAEGPIVATAVASDVSQPLSEITPVEPENPAPTLREPATTVLTIWVTDDLAHAEDPCMAAWEFIQSGATSDLVIEDVQALALESYPPQIILQVKGYAPDGCQVPRRVFRTQDGNALIVQISRQINSEMLCPAVITPFEEGVWFGAMEPGTYRIRVNDFALEVQV
jgi:hypothetical protein